MANTYNEPKYDTDVANKGYVDKVVGILEDDTAAGLDSKSKNFGSQPAPPYRLNDTWMNGTDIYICVNERLIGNYVSSDWQKASTYDNTKSILDGGVTTDGTLVVAKGGTVAAGLTAYTSGDNGVRIWAGSDINGINSAPFRVTQAGYLYASNANISGTITATSGSFTGTLTSSDGSIGGWTIGNKRLYSGSGTSYVRLDSNPDVGTAIWCGAEAATSAPFRVAKSGYLYASNANITGTLTATAGSIAGWQIYYTKDSGGTVTGSAIRNGSNNNFYLGTLGITATIGGTSRSNIVFKAGNNFGVNSSGTLYAKSAVMTDVDISGKITATSGTIGGCSINSSGVLQVADANITGTISTSKLSSDVITTTNFSAQNINANKINAGVLTSAGVNIYNGTGFLKMLYTSWAHHPYVSALNIAQGGGGLAFRTGQNRDTLGSTYGSLALLSSGGGAYYLELGTASGVNLNFNSGDRIGFDSDGNDIRLGRLHIKKSDTDLTATMTTANDYTHARITLYNSGKVNLVATGSESVYASSPAVSSNKVLVGNSGASSKNVKKNITPFTDEKYDKALKLLDNIKLYDYEYKYDLYEDRKQYGFIIDEVQDLDKDSEFFKFYTDTATVENEHLDFSKENKELPTIDVKFYNPDTLDKYLLACIKGLQHKIEELEKEIDHLKGGN